MANKIEKELRDEILKQLKKVSKKSCPNIYQRIQEGAYRQIEEMIINMVINDHITPSACIPQIESEL